MDLADPKSVFLAGDWHGNREWAQVCFEAAARAGCPVMLQLGDFGLWPGREDAWLDHVEKLAAEFEVAFRWIDGNHEHHSWLEGCGTGIVPLRPHVTWAARGARWNWSGVRFGALGGAVSIDRFLRRAGVNWWPQEIVTDDDVDRLGDGDLDVLATHASPVPVGRPLRLPASIAADVRSNRQRVATAVARTRPRLVVHGHHHFRHSADMGCYRVEGFSRDGAAGAWGVLDLDKVADLVVRTPTAPVRPLLSPASGAWRGHLSQSGESARG